MAHGRNEMATISELYEAERPVSDCGVEVPDWIEQDIDTGTLAAICEGGCASGAYMPAVTYWQATETMAQHGDEVLDYLQSTLGELPPPKDSESWSGMAVHYLNCAVELWALGVAEEIDLEDNEE